MRKLNIIFFMAAAVLTGALTACTDKESSLGIGLVDTTMLYEGKTDTLFADKAWTEYEDSLLTSNYSFGVIGFYSDPTFGKVSSTLYTQIGLSPNTNGISFDSSMVIDSVVLTLTKSQSFPDTGRTYTFHFEVKQLAEALQNDTSFYANNSLPVDESTLFFDDDITVSNADTLIRLTLNPSIYSVIHREATSEEFLNQTKGLRIRTTAAGDEGLVSIDFSSAQTCLRTYYHYINPNSDTTFGYYTFLMGAGTSHFTHFEHDYSGTLFASGNAVPGTYRLYLEPMGGQRVRMSFNRDLKAFHAAHPYAVIHHAELIMPLSVESPTLHPDQVLILGKDANGLDIYIDDLIDLYTLSGYDGNYHEDGNYYRMRVTQHLQGLLRQGNDNGLLLLLNSRRHAPQRAIFNGINMANAPKIIFVYSE